MIAVSLSANRTSCAEFPAKNSSVWYREALWMRRHILYGSFRCYSVPALSCPALAQHYWAPWSKSIWALATGTHASMRSCSVQSCRSAETCSSCWSVPAGPLRSRHPNLAATRPLLLRPPVPAEDVPATGGKPGQFRLIHCWPDGGIAGFQVSGQTRSSAFPAP